MVKNTYVTIVASAELSELRLGELAGRRGLVVEDLACGRKKNRGALVLLEEAYLDEFLWFIPENAMAYE
uniref:Uncharacterized protein n=1 Tax=virus sp. ct5rm7 TaxID=2827298 RepID=A0A8S5RFR5_9VIRU|nr:MAG TPA: hypothetical protein [virus sp. ct5rm7]